MNEYSLAKVQLVFLQFALFFIVVSKEFFLKDRLKV